MNVRGRTPHPTALDRARRARELDALADTAEIDVLVIGGGATGAGVALDAASRGLRTVLVERRDLAHGTSRWSSKLIHGGLRYLASGQFGIAHESAAERHRLMTRIAPHLIRPLAQVVPLFAPGHRQQAAVTGVGYALGDGLRRVAGTGGDVLPVPGPISAREALRLAPGLRADALRGAWRGWDGQLIDDARLVVAIARTAAGYGASVLTRVEATAVGGDRATLRDALTGVQLTVRARAVVNATGVWAGSLDREVTLRPSRGTHLVVPSERLGGSDVSLTVPVPGSTSRFVFTLPAMHGRTYIGLTDVATDGEVPDVPLASDPEIDELLDVVGTALARPLGRHDVLASYAGLRPLWAGGEGATSDLSRRHVVSVATSGLISVVGGKLTTYRRMAEDAVDTVVRERLAPRGTPLSGTRDLPLVGAWPRERRSEIAAPERLVRRYGAEAPYVAALADGPAGARGVTARELEWGVRVEGALTVDDLLHRRTRLGLVERDAQQSEDAATAAFARVGVEPA